MISIVGGTYFEICFESNWKEFFGSGLRAAALLTSLSDGVTLHTYVGENEIELLNYSCSLYKVTNNIIKASQSISFTYLHGLSIPEIEPPFELIQQNESHKISSSSVLQFGMLEGNAHVEGDWVVYDPQNEYDPEPFSKYGSNANHLAIVANYNEAIKLSGKTKVKEIGKTLIENFSAEVVVIKRGPLGATVITKTGFKTVPAFKTPNVFPIGSGDVFSAAFSHFWAELHLDPVEAAYNASIIVAHYCSTRSLSISKDILEKNKFEPIKPSFDSEGELNKASRIYLAGPFFNMAQRWMITEARNALLSANFQVFSPFHDVGFGKPSIIASKDIKELNKSDIVFAVLDGLDSGTSFEIGYAIAKGIPIVIFVQSEEKKDLLMFSGTGCHIFKDFVSAIYQTNWIALTK